MSSVTFDISDLIRYLATSRLPTGIQRVQIGVVLAALAEKNKHAVDIVSYSETKRFWQQIPVGFFKELCDAAQAAANAEEAWRAVLGKLSNHLSRAPRYEFSAGTHVINLGTAWSLPNYLLAVRNLRRSHNIKYIQYIHDLIPVILPDTCAPGLPSEFTEWLVSAFASTDLFLVNSQTTSTDLLRAAQTLGVSCPPVARVPLNVCLDSPAAIEGLTDILKRERLDRFVLMVGTLEPRKNHLFAFDVWAKLIANRGEGTTPTLVCVGRKGWLFEPIFSRLQRDPTLCRKIRLLENVTDLQLKTLYKQAIFTFYPSKYEGWGMPVTESLCHGKIPLVPKAGPFTEAGAAFARYFAPGSKDDCLSQVQFLLDSTKWRQDQEDVIRARFRPRTWSNVWADIKNGLQKVQRSEPTIPVLPEGQILSFCRLAEVAPKPGLATAEIYRAGEGWLTAGASGCDLTGEGAELHFAAAQCTDSQLRVYLAVRGSANEPIVVTVECDTGGSARQTIEPKMTQWLSLRVAPPTGGLTAHKLRIFTTPKATVVIVAIAASLEADLSQRAKILESALQGL